MGDESVVDGSVVDGSVVGTSVVDGSVVDGSVVKASYGLSEPPNPTELPAQSLHYLVKIRQNIIVNIITCNSLFRYLLVGTERGEYMFLLLMFCKYFCRFPMDFKPI